MELEAKFALPNASAGRIIMDSALVRGYAVGPVRTLRMESAYYGDAGGKLDAQRITLRLRRENARRVCCLKQDVRDVGVVKHRIELECEAETIEAGVQGLLAAGAPAAFAEAVQDAELRVTARVAFTRECVLLNADGAEIELAFDAGAFGSRGDVPFWELEAEWKGGREAAFHAFVQRLAREFRLTPQTKSKFIRARDAETAQS